MEKLFKTNETVSLERLEKIISEEINDDIINNEEDINLDKWAAYPAIYLENNGTRDKITEFITYIDELDIPRVDKISLVLSLVYLIVKFRFDILNIDVNNIYLLISYLEKDNLDNSLNKLAVINDEELLYKIRCFSLDMNVREKLLDFVIRNKLAKDDFIKILSDNSYYEVLERIK